MIEASFGSSWAESLAILEHYRVQLPVARQSIQTLKALKGKCTALVPNSEAVLTVVSD